MLIGLLACILPAAIEQESKYIHSPHYIEVFEYSEFLIGTDFYLSTFVAFVYYQYR